MYMCLLGLLHKTVADWYVHVYTCIYITCTVTLLRSMSSMLGGEETRSYLYCGEATNIVPVVCGVCVLFVVCVYRYTKLAAYLIRSNPQPTLLLILLQLFLIFLVLFLLVLP